MLQTYKIEMSCGHIEGRKMREALAGVPWSEDVVLHSSPGAKCALCRAREQVEAIYNRSLDAGTSGPWMDQVAQYIKGMDAEAVVNRVYKAMPGTYSWIDAFLAVMHGNAARWLETKPLV